MSYRKANIRKSCESIDRLIDLIYLKTCETLFEGINRGKNLITINLAKQKIKEFTQKIKRPTWRGEK